MSKVNEEIKKRSNVIGPGNRKLDFIRKDPEIAAVVSKLVEDVAGTTLNQRGQKHARLPSDSLHEMISERTTNNINEANSMFQLLPEVELARQILVSSILSPNDLTRTELHFTHTNTSLDSEVVQSLLTVVDKYFDNTYKIKKILSPILSNCLFETGSYPMLILPENSIDEAINSPERVSMESIYGEFSDDGTPVPIGILGDPSETTGGSGDSTRLSLESLSKLSNRGSPKYYKIDQLHIELTDNPSILKLPMLVDKLTTDRVHDAYSMRKIGLESYRSKKGMTPGELNQSIYRKRRYSYVPVLAINDDLDGETQGHPLVMKLPSEAVIPVHVPSNPEDHLGYFVLLDTSGNPLSKALEADYYNELQNNLRSNKELGPRLLSRTMQGAHGRDYSATPEEIEQMVMAYTDMVEHELMKSLTKGIYGETVEVSRPTEVYRIMLARAAAKMQTRLLYVPASLMTYFAFDYNSFGIGRSLLEKSKLLGSIRAVLLFANTMAAVRNSVGRTGLRIQLDPEDPDPNRTVEFLVHEYTRTSKAGYPLGESNPNDIVNYLQKASIDLQVEGNPRYPETKMEVEDNGRSFSGIDTDLEENMRHRHIMSWGLSPETIDMSANVDFATSIVSSNLLLSKRVMLYQETFTEQIADFIRKYVVNSGKLIADMHKVLDEHKSKIKGKEPMEIINKFLNSLLVTLPSPDSSTLENQVAAFQTYEGALEMALEAYFSVEFLTAHNLDDLSESAEETRAALKAYFLRQWLRNNNMLPELNSLTTFGEGDGEALDLMASHSEHIDAIATSLQKYMEAVSEAKLKRELRNQQKEMERQLKQEAHERKIEAAREEAERKEAIARGEDPDEMDSSSDEGEDSGDEPAEASETDEPEDDEGSDDEEAETEDTVPADDDAEESEAGGPVFTGGDVEESEDEAEEEPEEEEEEEGDDLAGFFDQEED